MYFFLEEIDLVEEENKAGTFEERMVADRVEKYQRFGHTVGIFIFKENLVVARHRYKENDCSDVIKEGGRLSAFRTLATDINMR